MTCFECEVVKTCESCLKRINQITFYSTKNNKINRLPGNEMVICSLLLKEKWIIFKQTIPVENG